MSTAELRRQVIAEVERLPAKKLASLADYAQFLGQPDDGGDDRPARYGPAFRKSIKDAEADYAAGRSTPVASLVRKGVAKPAARKKA